MRLSLLLLLALCALPARAADPYADFKPFYGSWFVIRNCGNFIEHILVHFSRLEKTVLVDFRDPDNIKKHLGRVDVVYDGQPDHYRIFTAVPQNIFTKAVGAKRIDGSISFDDDPDQPGGPGKNYITGSSEYSTLTSRVTIKLVNKKKMATFRFELDTPIGGRRCKGTAVVQPTPDMPK